MFKESVCTDDDTHETAEKSLKQMQNILQE